MARASLRSYPAGANKRRQSASLCAVGGFAPRWGGTACPGAAPGHTAGMVAAGPWGGCGQGDLSQPEGCGAPSGAQPLSRCPGSARGRAGHLYCGHCDTARPLRAAPSPFPSLMAGAVAPPWGRGMEAAAPRVPGRRCCLPASKMAAGEPGAPGGSGRAAPPPPGTARVRAGARGRRPPRSAGLPAAPRRHGTAPGRRPANGGARGRAGRGGGAQVARAGRGRRLSRGRARRGGRRAAGGEATAGGGRRRGAMPTLR